MLTLTRLDSCHTSLEQLGLEQMQLRNTAAGRNTMQQAARPAFEEGAALVFSKWTALGLAVENEWGGRNSRQKADDLIEEAIQWFYSQKGGPTPSSQEVPIARPRVC